MQRSLGLPAALLSAALFAAFVLGWHVGTRGTSAVQQMDPEYAS